MAREFERIRVLFKGISSCLEETWIPYEPLMTVESALTRLPDTYSSLPWHTLSFAVFGQPVERETRLKRGDRLEILRDLLIDPKAARRHRARLRAHKKSG